jgi:hypothetical protein
MEGFNQVCSVISVIIGVLSGLLSLYAKYLDLKHKAARESHDRYLDAATPAQRRGQLDDFDEAISTPRSKAWDRDAIIHAREMVKRPAISMMQIGGLSLISTLFMSWWAGSIERA